MALDEELLICKPADFLYLWYLFYSFSTIYISAISCDAARLHAVDRCTFLQKTVWICFTAEHQQSPESGLFAHSSLFFWEPLKHNESHLPCIDSGVRLNSSEAMTTQRWTVLYCSLGSLGKKLCAWHNNILGFFLRYWFASPCLLLHTPRRPKKHSLRNTTLAKIIHNTLSSKMGMPLLLMEEYQYSIWHRWSKILLPLKIYVEWVIKCCTVLSKRDEFPSVWMWLQRWTCRTHTEVFFVTGHATFYNLFNLKQSLQ